MLTADAARSQAPQGSAGRPALSALRLEAALAPALAEASAAGADAGASQSQVYWAIISGAIEGLLKAGTPLPVLALQIQDVAEDLRSSARA